MKVVGLHGLDKVLFFAAFGGLYLLSGLFFWSILARLLSSGLKRFEAGESWFSVCWRYLFGRLSFTAISLLFLPFAALSLWLSWPEFAWEPLLLIALLLALLFGLSGTVIVTHSAYQIGKGCPDSAPRELARGLGIPWAMFGALIFLVGLGQALMFWKN